MDILNEIEGDKYYCEYCHDDDINQHYLFIYKKENGEVIKTYEGGDAGNLCDLLLHNQETESKVDEIALRGESFLSLPSQDEIDKMCEEHEKEQLNALKEQNFNADMNISEEDIPF